MTAVVDLEPAAAGDAVSLWALREQAARWLADRDIEQWSPGEIGLDEVRRQVEAGEWFVLRRSGAVAAGLRFLRDDEATWGSRPGEAAYVHGLVVDREHAGEGLGTALLAWAQDRARSAGLAYLRLDCVQSNPALRRYYTAAGFEEVGRRDRDSRWHAAVLFEKRLR